MRHRRLPVWWLAIPALLVAAAIAPPGGQLAAVTLTENFDQTFPLRGGGVLTLNNVNGAVIAEAWDRDEVRVQATKKVKAGSDEEARQLMSRVKIEIDQAGGNLRIDTKLPRHEDGFLGWLGRTGESAGVEYHLQVPRRVEAHLQSVNGRVSLAGTSGNADLGTTNGGIQVEHVEGRLRLGTTNGTIKIVEAAGSVKAETTNGGIDARLTRVDGDLSLETTNGGVSVRLPRDVHATLDASTSNGSVHSDFAVAGGTSGRHHLSGTINGGGGKLSISTTNGGIHIGGD